VHRNKHESPLKLSFDIVEMELADINDLMEIERLSFPTPWSKNFFMKEYHSRFSKVFLVKSRHPDKQKVIGYICLWFVFDEVHILNLACHPHFRRQKVATALIEHCMHLSFENGTKKAFLEVRESNNGARALYARCGFKPIGLRKGYYSDTREDAIVMFLEMKAPFSYTGEH